MEQKFIKKKWQYIIAFVCPILAVICHCIIRESWIFGDGSILGGDLGNQYVYLFYELWDRVHTHDFSFISWNAQAGVDIYLNFLYYVMSPSTLIVLALPKSMLEDALQVVMVLKWSLFTVSAVYYFMHTKLNTLQNHKQLLSLILGLCFTMNSFFVNIIQYINWYDCFIVFPLLLLLIEKMVDKGSWKKYCLLLAYAMICNFYIAFPMCIWFVIYYIFVAKGNNKKKYFIRFVGSSILSAIISIFVILPEVVNVGRRYIDSVSDKGYITHLTMSVSNFVERFWGFQPPVNSSETDFFLSFGALMVMLLYWNTKIKSREKITDTCILVFLYVSTAVGALNYVWHGLSIPHGFNPRFAFVVILFMLILVLKTLAHLNDIKLSYAVCVAILQLLTFLDVFFSKTEFTNAYAYLIDFGLILFYGMILVLFAKKSIKQKAFIYIVSVICAVELLGNAYILLESYNVRTVVEDARLENVEELVERMESESGERVIFANANMNAGLRLDVDSLTGFVSYSNGNMVRFMNYMGAGTIQDAGNIYSGAFPLLNKLMNIGYGVSEYDNAFYNSEIIDSEENKNLFKIKDNHGLGYMMNSNVKDFKVDEISTFVSQNKLVECITGKKDELYETVLPDNLELKTMLGSTTPETKADSFRCNFVPVYDEDAAIILFDVKEDGEYFINIRSSKAIKLGTSVDSVDSGLELSKSTQHSCYLGNLKKGQNVKIIIGTVGGINQPVIISGRLAKMNPMVWQEVEQELEKSIFEVENMKGNVIEGKINADKAGLMFTAIPVMKGYNVFVDGEQITPETVENAFYAVPLDKGEHTVRFEYETPYAVLGIWISVVGFLVYVGLCALGKRRKKYA